MIHHQFSCRKLFTDFYSKGRCKENILIVPPISTDMCRLTVQSYFFSCISQFAHFIAKDRQVEEWETGREKISESSPDRILWWRWGNHFQAAWRDLVSKWSLFRRGEIGGWNGWKSKKENSSAGNVGFSVLQGCFGLGKPKSNCRSFNWWATAFISELQLKVYTFMDIKANASPLPIKMNKNPNASQWNINII